MATENQTGDPPIIGKTTYWYNTNLDCPYKNECCDEGASCLTCANNKKKSHYRPMEPNYPTYPTYPTWPVYPYPWTPVVTCYDGREA